MCQVPAPSYISKVVAAAAVLRSTLLLYTLVPGTEQLIVSIVYLVPGLISKRKIYQGHVYSARGKKRLFTTLEAARNVLAVIFRLLMPNNGTFPLMPNQSAGFTKEVVLTFPVFTCLVCGTKQCTEILLQVFRHPKTGAKSQDRGKQKIPVGDHLVAHARPFISCD